VIASLDQQKN